MRESRRENRSREMCLQSGIPNVAPDPLDTPYGVKGSEEERKEKEVSRVLPKGKIGQGS